MKHEYLLIYFEVFDKSVNPIIPVAQHNILTSTHLFLQSMTLIWYNF